MDNVKCVSVSVYIVYRQFKPNNHTFSFHYFCRYDNILYPYDNDMTDMSKLINHIFSNSIPVIHWSF